MQISGEIGKYLRFPLSRNRQSRDTFHYVIEQVHSRLSAWKANCLSMARRITLAKSVLSTIPLFPMQVARVPTSICMEIVEKFHLDVLTLLVGSIFQDLKNLVALDLESLLLLTKLAVLS